MMNLAASAPAFSHNPTIDLLLRCVSPAPNEQVAQQIEAIAQSQIDWPALMHLAYEHRVVALLYYRLEAVTPTAAHPNYMAALRHRAHKIALRNLSSTAELRRLLGLMSTAGVDTLPYKGPVLTQMLYGSLKRRSFGDLDIIIQPQDMPSVEKLLIAEGYRPYFGKKTAAELAEYMASKNEHTYDFYHSDKHVLVEVHWRFWPPYFSTVNPSEVWPRRERTKLIDREVSTFSTEDYLIVLCMHGSRHVWQRLSWLCDIAMLLEKYPALDWQKVFSQAEQWGATRMLCVGLYLAREWLGASLCAIATQAVAADPTIPLLADCVKDQMFSIEQKPRRFISTTRYQVKVRERWQDKAAYAESFVYWLLKGRFEGKKVPA